MRKGLWSPEEDDRLASHIARFGVSCWSSIPELAGTAAGARSIVSALSFTISLSFFFRQTSHHNSWLLMWRVHVNFCLQACRGAARAAGFGG